MVESDKKAKAALIIAAMKPGKVPESEAGEGEDDEAGDQAAAKEDAAQGVMDALSANDPKSMVSALETFISLCDY